MWGEMFTWLRVQKSWIFFQREGKCLHILPDLPSLTFSPTITGFVFHPGTLTSVGLLLVASSVLSLANRKRRSKLLFVSTMVPTVYAAVSFGIILFISSVTSPNSGYHNYAVNGRTYNGFPIGLAIFGSLALTITTTASAILSSKELGRDSNDKIRV